MKTQYTCHTFFVAMLMVLLSVPCFAAADEPQKSDYGTLTGQARTYYFTQRNKTTGNDFDNVRESLAIGGSLKYETPWLADFFGVGLTGYMSTPLFGALNEHDEGGTGLLTPKNRSIFVLGEAYAKFRYSKTEARVWRQILNTPLINANDSRMIPQTFEAYGVKSSDIENLELSLYWVDKEKARDTEIFVSMSEMAGLNGTQNGVLMAGADWTPMEQLSTRFWNYYAHDIDNSFYAEAEYSFGKTGDVEFLILAQALDQRSVGDDRRGDYNTGEFGVMGTVKWIGFNFDLGGSIVSDDADIRNSWGNYPFFNNMMSYAFNRAEEKALFVGAGYDFERQGLKGFTASLKAGFGNVPDSGSNASFDRNEYDLNLNYKFDGDLKGLSLLNRWSYQDAEDAFGGRDGYQVRLRLQYDFQLM